MKYVFIAYLEIKESNIKSIEKTTLKQIIFGVFMKEKFF